MAMDKYEMYVRAVQDPDNALDFIEWECQKRKLIKPKTLGEDFCGTFAMSCAWVERGAERKAVGVDLSLAPVRYGMRHNLSELTEKEQKRVHLVKSDVRHPKLPKADVICAFNFSYFVFKERKQLLEYFINCRRRLNRRGVLFLDIFGGSEIQHRNCDVLEFRKFTYYWDQVSFDPMTHEAKFYIHFKEKGVKGMKRAFRYDWRIWTIPEVKDVLEEAGFKKTYVAKEPLRKSAWIATLTATT